MNGRDTQNVSSGYVLITRLKDGQHEAQAGNIRVKIAAYHTFNGANLLYAVFASSIGGFPFFVSELFPA